MGKKPKTYYRSTSFSDIPKETWERIFGKKEEIEDELPVEEAQDEEGHNDGRGDQVRHRGR
jgi:hypothetical protein